MNLLQKDEIWNRAALQSGGPHPRAGDRALSDLLLFDGMAANGGLGHAYDVLSEEELAAAIRGFRFFGLIEVATLIEELAPLEEEEQEDMSSRYYDASERIHSVFEFYYQSQPEAFAPLDELPPDKTHSS